MNVTKKEVGTMIREIRLARGLTLKDLACEDITASHIGKFERGESTISIDRMLPILSKLNVTVDEFFNSLNGYQVPDISRKMKAVHHCYNEQNVTMLQRLLEEEENERTGSLTYHRLNSLMIRHIIRLLTGDDALINEADKLFLSDYLLGIEYWTEYELMIFGNCNSLLSTRTIIALGKEMMQRSMVYKEIDSNATKIKITLINIYDNMIDRKQEKAARYFGKQLEAMLETRDLYEKAHFEFLNAYFDWQFSDDKKGAMSRMENVIKALEMLKSHQIADLFSLKLSKLKTI